jgi:hypothetical protein
MGLCLSEKPKYQADFFNNTTNITIVIRLLATHYADVTKDYFVHLYPTLHTL